MVEYMATTENKYVHKGSASWMGVQWPFVYPKKIITAETITPMDKIMSLMMWMWAASMFIFINFFCSSFSPSFDVISSRLTVSF